MGVEHADHPVVQPNTFVRVHRLTSLVFISRQAVRSCIGSFFAKRVHISRALEIDAHWSVVFGKLDENGADPMFFGIFCLEFHSLFRAPGNANNIFTSCICRHRARPTKSLPDPSFFVAVARPTIVGTARRHSSVLQWCSTLIGYLGSRRDPSVLVAHCKSSFKVAFGEGTTY